MPLDNYTAKDAKGAFGTAVNWLNDKQAIAPSLGLAFGGVALGMVTQLATAALSNNYSGPSV